MLKFILLKNCYDFYMICDILEIEVAHNIYSRWASESFD